MGKLGNLLKSELLTKLNLVATAILLWIVNQPGAPTEQVLKYLPDSWHGLITAIAPVIWMIIVQLAIGELKNREPDKPVEPEAK